MPRFRFGDPWRFFWRIATSDYLLGAVLLALALTLLLAAGLPQTSQDGSDMDVVWQAEVQRRFGGVAWFDTIRPLLQAMGAFHISDALGLRLLLALLAFALVTRLVDSVERLWLEGRGRANSRPWRDLGSTGVYLGGLMVLLGAALTSLWGWQMGPFPVTAGDSVPLGHGTELTLRLVSLTPDGQRGVGELWRGEDTLINAGDLAVGQPLEGNGVGLYLVGSGDALWLHATSSEGEPLELVTGPGAAAREDPVLIFTRDEPRRLVGVSEADLVLLLTKPEAEQSDARLQVQVYESGSGELILGRNTLDDTTLVVRDVTFTFTPAAYAKIRAVYDRGAFWIQLGVIGLLVGGVLWGWWSRRKADSNGSIASIETANAGGEDDSVSRPQTWDSWAHRGEGGGT